jgi:response regulator RpfG family c-di-GMP phosphodiesterase
MSGFELVTQARSRLPDLASVVITGYASMDNVVEAVRCGVDDLVTKPFSVTEIRKVVSRVIRGKRGSLTADPVAADGPGDGAANGNGEANGEADAPTTALEAVSDEAPHDGAAMAAAHDALSQRLRASSLVDDVHGLLGEDLASSELIRRCGDPLMTTLDVGHAVLLDQGPGDGLFRVRSATAPQENWTVGADLEMPALDAVISGGVAAAIDATGVGPLLPLLGDGPLAACATSAEPHDAANGGVLVVSRSQRFETFDSEDLRLLGVAARSIGNVFRALSAAERTESAYVDTLCGVVKATEGRSPYFARHSLRVRHIARALGRAAGVSDIELDVLDIGARLLDLGRVTVPDDVLLKTGAPTDDEWVQLRRHTNDADRLINPIGRLRHVKPLVRHHHENWDGTGYPDGLEGDEIPYLAALVRIADAYAALTSPRSWREALDHQSAVNQIVAMSGTHFHPGLVEAFAESGGITSDVNPES